MSIQAVDDKTFDARLGQSGMTLVEFGATWCPPCKALQPILNELSDEYGDQLPILTIDCDESPDTASRFGIMSMPTVIVFQDGKAVDKLVGLRPKNAFKNVIDKHAVTA